MKALLALAAVLSVAVSSGPAAAGGSYTGNWPVKAKLPPHFGNTACLTLTDNGSPGSPHSGPVTSTGDLTGDLSGTFQVVDDLLVVNLQSSSSTGEVIYISFVAPAHDGRIVGKGVFNDPGYFAVVRLIFGQKTAVDACR